MCKNRWRENDLSGRQSKSDLESSAEKHVDGKQKSLKNYEVLMYLISTTESENRENERGMFEDKNSNLLDLGKDKNPQILKQRQNLKNPHQTKFSKITECQCKEKILASLEIKDQFQRNQV